MPYHWTETSDEATLLIWPHKSLSKEGFKWFMGVTAALISLPLIAVLGTAILWGLLPFFAGTLALLWWLIERNDKDLNIQERLNIRADLVQLTRDNPRSASQGWECNLYWTSLHMHPNTGPVPNYLTLRGNGREVELGAFLSEDERTELYSELKVQLTQFREK